MLGAVDHPHFHRSLRRIELQSELLLNLGAPSIWVIAAIGIAVGAGLWRASIIVVVISETLLVIGGPIDRFVHRLSRKSNQE